MSAVRLDVDETRIVAESCACSGSCGAMCLTILGLRKCALIECWGPPGIGEPLVFREAGGLNRLVILVFLTALSASDSDKPVESLAQISRGIGQPAALCPRD